MPDDNQSQQLLARCREGDEQAAEMIFDLYVQRLVALARSRLSPKLQRRIDPEDVVQSAYRSFFRSARQGGFADARDGEMWKLLAGITIKKMLHQAEFHQARKRAIDNEGSVAASSNWNVNPEFVAHEPSPAEAVTIVDELNNVMQTLKPLHRQVLEMRLQGLAVRDIAKAVDRTERTIRRTLEAIREMLHQRLFET